MVAKFCRDVLYQNSGPLVHCMTFSASLCKCHAWSVDLAVDVITEVITTERRAGALKEPHCRGLYILRVRCSKLNSSIKQTALLSFHFDRTTKYKYGTNPGRHIMSCTYTRSKHRPSLSSLQQHSQTFRSSARGLRHSLRLACH